ncbi:MAG: M15 family metallopeptidase [Treponema sp.]|jgi:peptidoglycan L-alanyl-D-glutamate endopeptidase CwlK|nr:M15 family metallopeptidase [Treponema sp.]
MGINRSIDALKPDLAGALRKALARYGEENLPVLIIETDRLQIVQDAYYAQGRESIEEVNRRRKTAGLYPLKERENTVITNARVSNHTGGRAVDLCPEIPGKPGYPWWSAPKEVWEKMGKIAEECGLDWCAGGYGQTWGAGWDNPHFEFMG